MGTGELDNGSKEKSESNWLFWLMAGTGFEYWRGYWATCAIGSDERGTKLKDESSFYIGTKFAYVEIFWVLIVWSWEFVA